jgi:hypothetical protein
MHAIVLVFVLILQKVLLHNTVSRSPRLICCGVVCRGQEEEEQGWGFFEAIATHLRYPYHYTLGQEIDAASPRQNSGPDAGSSGKFELSRMVAVAVLRMAGLLKALLVKERERAAQGEGLAMDYAPSDAVAGMVVDLAELEQRLHRFRQAHAHHPFCARCF